MESVSPSPPTNCARGFSRFRDCPPEVRTIIWTHALERCEPRLVYLREQALNLDSSIYARVRSDNKTPPTTLDLQPTPAFLLMSSRAEIYLIDTVLRCGSTVEAFIKREGGILAQEVYFQSRMASKNEGERIFLPRESGIQEEDLNEENMHKARYLVLRRDDAGTTEIEWPKLLEPEHIRGFRKTLSIPSLLLACSESNAVASKAFEVSFPTLGCPPDVHFNFAKDFLFVDPNSFYDQVKVFTRSFGVRSQVASCDFQRVRNLSVLLPEGEPYGSVADSLSVILGIFGNIKNLTILGTASTYPGRKYDPLGKPQQGPFLEHHADLVKDIELVMVGHFGLVDTDDLLTLKIRDDRYHDRANRDSKHVQSFRWEMPVIRYAKLRSCWSHGY